MSCCRPRAGDPDKLAGANGERSHFSGAKEEAEARVTPAAGALVKDLHGDAWTTQSEWMAYQGPRHLVLGQEHRLVAGRCEEETGKVERQGCLCGFSPAKGNALKTRSESSVATSAGTFVAAPKH